MKHPGSLSASEQSLVRAAPESHSRQTARLALFARLALGDALAIFIAFSLGARVRGSEWLNPDGINLILIVMPIMFLIGTNNKAYSLEALGNFAESARRIISASVQTFLALFAILFAFQLGDEISRIAVGIVFLTMVVFMLCFRYLSYLWVSRALGGVLIDELVIIDGVELERKGAKFVINAEENHLSPNLDDPAMLERFARITDLYDRILVACPPERQAAWAILLKTVDVKGELLVGQRDALGIIGLGQFGGSSTLIVTQGSLSLADRAKKRLFDLAIAIPALLFLAPLFILVAIGIKSDSPGPVFFRQPRVGRNNVPFQIFKFRSMRQESCDTHGVRSTGRDDDRISRFGRFIRKTSIDELPQLLNVLKGDMSMVGPRPHALGSTAEDRLFWQITHRYWERHALKPGITGLAQVRGYRGATEKTSDLTNRLNSDLEYLSGWRLWKDLAILVATLKVLVHPNAY